MNSPTFEIPISVRAASYGGACFLFLLTLLIFSSPYFAPIMGLIIQIIILGIALIGRFPTEPSDDEKPFYSVYTLSIVYVLISGIAFYNYSFAEVHFKDLVWVIDPVSIGFGLLTLFIWAIMKLAFPALLILTIAKGAFNIYKHPVYAAKTMGLILFNSVLYGYGLLAFTYA